MSQNIQTTPKWRRTAVHCYWAILSEPSRHRTSRRDQIRLDFAFEGELPMPIETVLTAYTPIDGQWTLACAVDRLAAQDALDDGILSLRPCEPPEFVRRAAPDAGDRVASMDFLAGRAAPKPVRRSRWRIRVEIATVLCLVTGVLLLGMQRRIELANQQAHDLGQARQTAIREVLPGASIADELALLSELRRLERSRAPSALPSGLDPNRDITPSLAHALQHWPTDLHARTRRLTASSGQLQLQTEIDAIEDSERLALALAGSDRWKAGVPRVESQGRGGFLATITLEAESGGTP